uniref:Uncharacterized protein n=1 Tax=Anopheles christyi TaxID=43041 RepID=A0A182KHS4_9DIPT
MTRRTSGNCRHCRFSHVRLVRTSVNRSCSQKLGRMLHHHLYYTVAVRLSAELTLVQFSPSFGVNLQIFPYCQRSLPCAAKAASNRADHFHRSVRCRYWF